jgi:hypothetical protein
MRPWLAASIRRAECSIEAQARARRPLARVVHVAQCDSARLVRGGARCSSLASVSRSVPSRPALQAKASTHGRPHHLTFSCAGARSRSGQMNSREHRRCGRRPSRCDHLRSLVSARPWCMRARLQMLAVAALSSALVAVAADSASARSVRLDKATAAAVADDIGWGKPSLPGLIRAQCSRQPRLRCKR